MQYNIPTNSKLKLWDYSDFRIQSLVFKLTEQCNLFCDYCYRSEIKRENLFIDIEVIQKSILSYASWIEKIYNKERVMYLIWHGGEPLLFNIKKFEEIYKLINDLNSNGWKIITSFQTNGTLINQEWIDFFLKNKILIGISIDGPKNVQDIHRKGINNKSCFNKINDNLDIISQCHLPVSTISVITNKNVFFLKESLDYFVQKRIHTTDFIPGFFYENSMTIDANNYADALIELYDYWAAKYKDKIYIRFLGDIEAKIKCKAKSIACELCGTCGENFSINTKGDIFPCECVSIFNKFKLGNIIDNSFEQIIEGVSFEKWKSLFNKISNECINCEILNICRGGCFNRRLSIEGKGSDKDVFCIARKKIIKHIEKVHKRKKIIV